MVYVPELAQEDRMLYWAYGSNLSVASMARRCPAAKKLIYFPVHDAKLVFRSCADVVVNRGTYVPGGLWSITEACERSLDVYEGVASKFYIKKYFTLRDGRKVLYYQMSTRTGVMPPADGYLSTIVEGYRDFKVPDQDYAVLNAALAASWSDKEVTPMLKERHVRKGQPSLARGMPSSVRPQPSWKTGLSR